jgi:hypothetical protein
MKQKSGPDKVPVARKGIRLNRRRIASSVDFSFRLVVAGNDDLELRDTLEKVTAHEPRRHLIAASDRLDLILVPGAAAFRLTRLRPSFPPIRPGPLGAAHRRRQ